MYSAPIRTYLVDDHLSLLQLLALRISAAPDLNLAGTATDAETALREIPPAAPDVVVLDVELPGRGAFDLAAEITTGERPPKLVFFTGFLSDIFLDQALRVGARGYMLKGESVEALVECVRRVARGEHYFSPEVEERLRLDAATGKYVMKTETRLAGLTGRQLEVLRHLARGASVKEIARAMDLSEKSVDSHKYRIMAKLGIHDRVELARYAIREGLTTA